jgi:predicted nucleic acid-binding protein
MIVLDTNVLSEVISTPTSPRVLEWLAARDMSEVFITSITQAELLYGVELLPEGKRRAFLANAIDGLFSEDFQGRVLPFDEEAARHYSYILSTRRSMGRPMSQLDCMIAAISRSRQAALATRNTKDFENCGVTLINPWDE